MSFVVLAITDMREKCGIRFELMLQLITIHFLTISRNSHPHWDFRVFQFNNMHGVKPAVCWPCYTGRWSWWCTPGRRRQTAWPLPQYAGCFLPGLRRRSPGFCSVHGERCLRPGSNKEWRATRGTLPGQSWWWSSRRQTGLEDRRKPVWLLNNNAS